MINNLGHQERIIYLLKHLAYEAKFFSRNHLIAAASIAGKLLNRNVSC